MDLKPQQKHEMLIDGRLYDVSGFRHPGGSIIKFHMGSGDASEAFHEFHQRSIKAKKMLNTLPSRPAPKDPRVDPIEAVRLQKMSLEFARFRRELEREGWFKPCLSHVGYRCLEIIVMFTVGLVMLCQSPWVLGIPALFILGIATGRCGWLMHEGGHHSMTGIIPLDIRLQEIIYGVGAAMSGSWWRSQHNKHHAAPQKMHHDVDLNTLPLVAYNKLIALQGKSNRFVRFWIPLQQLLFYPVTCVLVALLWQLYLHPRHMIRTRNYFEMCCCACRFIVAGAIGYAQGATLGQVCLCWVLADFFGGIYIFGNFALSHTHLPVLGADEHVHWMEYSSKYTINISPHWFTNWWMGYLNYQIEHHLFPTMPQFRFVALSPRVKKLFEDNGLKYDVRDYFVATADTVRNLGEVAKTFDKEEQQQK